MLLVAILTISDEDAFVRFEAEAARIMGRYGGARERALRLEGEPSRELHVVRFPDAAALAAFRADPEIVALQALRARGISATEIWGATDVTS